MRETPLQKKMKRDPRFKSDRHRRIVETFPLRARGLAKCTNGFSQENFMGKFQFGEVYRGTFQKEDVIVKLWKDDNSLYKVKPGDNLERYQDEVRLQEHFSWEEFHPNIAKLYGPCWDGEYLGMVYLLKPKAIDTLHNLIEQDSFTWPQRIKVALGFASALEFMHVKRPTYLPFLIRNIHPAHILVDEDHEPVLFDFSMISGGILTDKRNLLNQYVDGCHGYTDPFCARPGKWSEKCDVFSYGVLLMGLIRKSVYKDNGEWATSVTDFDKSKPSLVHQSLESEPGFCFSDAIKITNLAMQCVASNPQKRPEMKQVVKHLQNLDVVKRHENSWEICKLLNIDDAIQQADKHSGKKSKALLPRHLRHFSQFFSSKSQLCGDFRDSNHPQPGKSIWGKDFDTVDVFSYENLSMFTDSFSKENFIGKFQFGIVFRGMFKEKNVMVKIWESSGELYEVHKGHNEGRMRDEIALLRHPELMSHPNLVKLIGYCHEEGKLGVVYDLEPCHSVYNLAPRDDFTWLQRIKVGYEFACLLKFLHTLEPDYKPYIPCIVRNIDAAHIILDKEYSPKLFDFGLFIGGVILDVRLARNRCKRGCRGYMDPDPFGGEWCRSSDVYAYGCVLLGLISKKIYTEEDIKNDSTLVSEWAIEQYDTETSKGGSVRSRFSLVDSGLEKDRDYHTSDGVELTKLALQCIDMDSCERPTMRQVVKHLLNLRVIRKHAKELGIKQKRLW